MASHDSQSVRRCWPVERGGIDFVIMISVKRSTEKARIRPARHSRSYPTSETAAGRTLGARINWEESA